MMRQAISPVVVQRDEGKTARQRKRESEKHLVTATLAKLKTPIGSPDLREIHQLYTGQVPDMTGPSPRSYAYVSGAGDTSLKCYVT